ncbi:MAG: hypothetical protein ACXIUM_03545 [Wenzhouxiangella sp.]
MPQSPDDKIHHLNRSASADHFSIPAEQLERVIARASILQHAEGDGEQRQLSEAEIIGIGKEVGLAPEYVRRALAEYRAEALAPPLPEDEAWINTLFGPAYTRVRRVLRGDPQEIHRAFEIRLRGEESMHPVRMRGTASVWEPNQSWMSKLTRTLDLEGRGFELSQLKSLSITTAPASPSEALVTLTADLSEARSEQMQAGIWWVVAAIIAALSGALFFNMPAFGSWLLSPVLVMCTLGLVVFTVRRNLEAQRRRAALLLEGLLDQLEFSRR